MSVIDKLRSFAETRCDDEELIRGGLTYGDAREVLKDYERNYELSLMSVSERCRRTFFQVCDCCDDLTCGDNLSAAKEEERRREAVFEKLIVEKFALAELRDIWRGRYANPESVPEGEGGIC